jgi:hypothetical protein
MTGDTVLAQVVIADEGPSPLPDHGRRWSLNLVVQGQSLRLAPLVNGHDVQEAAEQFARLARWATNAR